MQVGIVIQHKGALMKQFLLVTASSLALVSAAAAADLPVRQPQPAAAVVGKAPIGKAPIPALMPEPNSGLVFK